MPSRQNSIVLVLSAVFFLASAGSAHVSELKFEHMMSIGEEGTGEGQFKYVEDFAFTKAGQLLATDAAHAWVQVFDKTSGKYLGRFGGKGDDDQNLEKPEGIAVDSESNVFIADYITGFVKKYDRSFKWLMTFSEYGAGKGQNIKSEFMDIYGGKLYLPEAGNHRVNVFDLNGKFLFDFGGPGKEFGKFNVPESAKFSSDGKLYVADLMNNRIQVFDPQGRFLQTWGGPGSEAGKFRSPAGIALDKEDNVYVTEIGNDRVQVFNKKGEFLAMWGRKGSGAGEFGNLHGIIIDKSTGLVYVADTLNNRIQVFRRSGDFKS